jgi:hypothetical protein
MSSSLKPSTPPASFAHLYRPGGTVAPGPIGPHWTWPPPAPTPTPAPAPFKAAQYSFALVSMQIMNTRARHVDSDKASLSVAVGNGKPETLVKDLGDLNNGSFPIGLTIPGIEVADPQLGIAINYLILNSGHSDWKTIDGDLTQAGNALASAGAKAATSAVGGAIGATLGSAVLPVIGSILGAAAGWLIGEVVGLITADCDGPVAAEQAAYKGIDLWHQTQTPSRSFSHTTYHPGLDSASGCGSNSQYSVTWRITRA